jgi:LacI family transcriptional regulator
MSSVRNIAVAMELNWPFKRHYEIFAGMQHYAAKHANWKFHIGNFPVFEMVRGVKYDGILGRIDTKIFKAARTADVPVVNVWLNSPAIDQVPGVYVDCKSVGRMSVEHLIARGLRRFAHFGYKSCNASKAHYEGMLEATQKHGYPCGRHSVMINFDTKEGLWAQFFDYVTQVQSEWEAPLGIAFSDDQICYAVSSICRANGWKIPEQLTLIGANNEPVICNASDPSLSSIDLGDFKRGYEAARLLDELMQGKEPPAGPLYTQPKEVVVRRSSDFYAVNDAKVASALSYMAQHTGGKLSVTKIAQAVGIGRQTLERRFQMHLGRSINEELIRLRISKLKRLLVESEESIKELSQRSGFSTVANMHTMFKRATGLTPKNYRLKHGPPVKG